ncbi:hypothetical protein [Pedobacter antarcticus]|uniref:hypothetical protein n=1 Tax=Pedobacter antarcticus TaxID=34086 RepID=UPI00292D8015|nr:hypothetical protein [Pedobacter antarcticus]
MKKVNPDKAQIVDIEYEGAAKLLQPIVFKNGDQYSCVLGIDNQTCIYGSGDSIEQAIQEWDNNLQVHLESAGTDDPIVRKVKDIIGMPDVPEKGKKEPANYESHINSIKDPDVAEQVRAFYNQFD